MPKETLRDKLDGNELDLSVNNLETVPVKELAALPKATHLDLSSNLLKTLPDNFCSLTHIVRLDLSKNLLSELPRDFGQLDNLQHLDLLGNQLRTLPRSFCQLLKLKWLDLKDNPLEEKLKKNAGDCLNEDQCRKCAVLVLRYMTDYDALLEQQSQAELKKQRDAETKRKEKEERENQRKKQEKKAEKERRRRDHEARRAQEMLAQGEDTSDEELKAVREKLKVNGHAGDRKSRGSSSKCPWLTLFSFLVLVAALVVAIDFHCSANRQDSLCVAYWQPARAQLTSTWQVSRHVLSDLYHQHIEKYFLK